MSYSQYPQDTNSETTKQSVSTTSTQKKDNRNIIYGVLIAALIGSWGYIIYAQNKSKEEIANLSGQVSTVDSSRNEIQDEFNLVSLKLDSLTGTNTQLQGALAERNAELQKQKNEIAGLLKKNNLSASEKATLRSKIANLNGEIQNYIAEIEKLKGENQVLTVANTGLTAERDTLTVQKGALEQNLTATENERKRVEDVASTLHASNINITAINVKSGGKEKTTTTAKRADLMRVSFDIDENRIAASGAKDLYVVVTAPDGSAITNGNTFTTREEGDKSFTSKVDVNYEQGKRLPVSFDWKGDAKYMTGNYKIQIYHNGYKIGEGSKSLKKGGLFS